MVNKIEWHKYGWLILATIGFTSACFTLWADSRYVTLASSRDNEVKQHASIEMLDRRLLIIETQNQMILDEIKLMRSRFDKVTNSH